jgi:hypothetical protein
VRWPPACDDVSPGAEEVRCWNTLLSRAVKAVFLCDSDLKSVVANCLTVQ